MRQTRRIIEPSEPGGSEAFAEHSLQIRSIVPECTDQEITVGRIKTLFIASNVVSNRNIEIEWWEGQEVAYFLEYVSRSLEEALTLGDVKGLPREMRQPSSQMLCVYAALHIAECTKRHVVVPLVSRARISVGLNALGLHANRVAETKRFEARIPRPHMHVM